MDTGDPRFARFQFVRIHNPPRFFQDFHSMGTMGSMEPYGFQKIALKQQKSLETGNLALNQCFLSVGNIQNP